MSCMKINIIGASGTGKSTLAKAIAESLGCAHLDSDDYFHFPTDPPFRKQRSPEDRLSLLMRDLAKHSSWVLSGGAAVWEPAPDVEYSLAVLLYLPPVIRLQRLKDRERRLYGPRIEPAGDMASDHLEFTAWTAGYDDGTAEGTNTLARHLAFLRTVGCPTLKIETPMDTAEQVGLVMRQLKT